MSIAKYHDETSGGELWRCPCGCNYMTREDAEQCQHPVATRELMVLLRTHTDGERLMTQSTDQERALRQRIEDIVGDACATDLDIDDAAQLILDATQGELPRLRILAYGHNKTHSDNCPACHTANDGVCPYHSGVDDTLAAINDRVADGNTLGIGNELTGRTASSPAHRSHPRGDAT